MLKLIAIFWCNSQAVPVIIAEHKGRLGNQLFQLAGLLKLARPGERILLLGYEDLGRFLQTPAQVSYLNSKRLALYKIATRLFGLIFRLPPSIRGLLLCSLEEDIRTGCIARVGGRRSLLPVTLVKETYFLDDRLLDYNAFAPRWIHACWKTQAQRWFDARGLDPQSCCFLHVRRGDYVGYPSVEEPGVLPRRFFLEMMDRMRSKGFHSFVVASDDWPWVRDALSEVPPEHLLVGQAEVTIAVMARCAAGILSPSTFAWAGALFAGSSDCPGCFLAPLYWVGFRQKRWYPYAGVQSKTLTYVEWIPSVEESLDDRGFGVNLSS